MTDRLGGDRFIGELATALSFISGERKSSGSKVERASEVFQQQTTSRRLADRKIHKFEKNITKRGSVPETTVKKGNDYPVGPIP